MSDSAEFRAGRKQGRAEAYLHAAAILRDEKDKQPDEHEYTAFRMGQLMIRFHRLATDVDIGLHHSGGLYYPDPDRGPDQ